MISRAALRSKDKKCSDRGGIRMVTYVHIPTLTAAICVAVGFCVWTMRRMRWRARLEWYAAAALVAIGGWVLALEIDTRREMNAAQRLIVADAGVSYASALGDETVKHIPGFVDRWFRRPVGVTMPMSPDESKLTDKDLRGIEVLDNLEFIDIGGYGVTGAAFAGARYPKLKYVILDATSVDDEALAAFAHSPRLELMSLEGTKIVGWGFRSMHRCERLLSILLSDAKIVDLRHLHFAPNLDELTLSGTPLADEDLAQLAALDRLKTLDLSDTAVTSHGVCALGEMDMLEELILESTEVNDTVVECLTNVPLKLLDLSGTAVTDQAIPGLLKIRTLERVRVLGSKVSDAALDALREVGIETDFGF